MKEFIKGCAWFSMWLYFSIALLGYFSKFIPHDDTDPPHAHCELWKGQA